MSKLVQWWGGLAPWQKALLGVGGTVVVVATGGAAAYAIASSGAIVATSGGTVIAVGKVALELAAAVGKGKG